MIEYFSALPVISYRGRTSTNLMARAGLARGIVERYGVFYPYRVRDWERPDTIAFDYYGDSGYFWLVYAANGIVDPQHDWPLCDRDFDAFVRKKYGSRPAAEAIIHHYENVDPTITVYMSPETRANLPAEQRVGFDVEKTAYAWEEEKNEDKKSVRLLSRRYARQAMAALRTVFGGGRS